MGKNRKANSEILFSVAIATLNRPELLLRAVNSVLNQTYSNYEIIIVDQSDENHREQLCKLDSRIRYIHEEVKGLSHARNIALDVCTGDYFCLMDDDGVYSDTFLHEASLFLSKQPCEVLAGARYQSVREPTLLTSPREKTATLLTGYSFCMSPSMIISVNFLKRYRFDERFGIGAEYGAGEESDIVLLALEENGIVKYSPLPIVFHEDQKKWDIPLEKVKSYAEGYGALTKKHILRSRSIAHKVQFGIVVLKTVLGIVVYLPQKDKRSFFEKRLLGIVNGYRSFE